MKSLWLSLVFLLFSLCLTAQSKRQEKVLDSILKLRKLSQEAEDYEVKVNLANRAVTLSQELKIDSTLFRSYHNLSNLYLIYDKNDEYGQVNRANLKVAERINDSTFLSRVYNNLGYHYLNNELKNDSGYYYYYKASKLYGALGRYKRRADVLLNMANIQETERDYVGSQRNAIESLKILKTLPQDSDTYDSTFWIYNILAIVEQRFENYDKAIYYYDKAIEVSKVMDNNLYYQVQANNNKAYALEKMQKYDEAIEIYDELLKNQQLKEIDPELYIKVKGNIAYTKFLNKNTPIKEIKRDFLDGYTYGLAQNNQLGLLDIGGYMSEFYWSLKQKDTAKLIATRTMRLAKEMNSNGELLGALKLLSEIEEGEKGRQYLSEYIKLNDSLVTHERAIRNKFALIEFETDQLEADNAQLSTDNEQLAKERLLFIFISIGLLASLTLLYIVITQRAKNRKLEFIQQQQEANEEIYNLMLAQQDKIEEGRVKEKKRISEELHDGVLGKLFGTRLSLDSLNLITTKEGAKSREQYISELKNIETEIRKISHDLNTDFVSGSSFVDIITTLIETQTKAYQLNYDFRNDDSIDWEEIPNKTKIHIYRMLQESMQNIYKHANATFVKISFELKNNIILCAIEDNGEGFNINKARKGIGLKNIDSRVSEIGGKAEVFSKINVGTKIKIYIPLNS